jgi:type IV secretory pathway VirB4 component
MIIQNQDRNFMLQGVNEALVERLADSVSRSISMTMNPVAESMDRFIVGTTRNQIEGVNHIVSRFLSEMDRSMGNQFTSLAQTMSNLEQNQIRASQATGENLTAAEGIVRNAQSLQEVTSHALDQFDSYMTRIDEVRDRDENFEKNASELLREMRQESRDMTSLLNGLTEKMQGLSVPDGSSADKSLEEIRSLMTGLNDQVKTVSDTLTRLSKEA